MQANNEALKRATAKYDAVNTRQITLKLNKGTDKDVIDKLNSTGNRQGYIKELIRADMAKNKDKRTANVPHVNSEYPVNLIISLFMNIGVDQFFNIQSVEVAVNMLPPQERDMIHYIFRDNMSYKEIAVTMGIDIPTMHAIERAAFMDLSKPDILGKIRKVVTVGEYRKLIYENESLKATIKYLSQSPEQLAKIKEIPLEETTYLSYKTKRLLRANGYNTVGDLADSARADIESINGVGTIVMYEIDEMMMSYGLIFMGQSEISEDI